MFFLEDIYIIFTFASVDLRKETVENKKLRLKIWNNEKSFIHDDFPFSDFILFLQ